MPCPNCERTSWNSSYSFIGSKSDEITYIKKEVWRLEMLIRDLNNTQATLRRRLNALESPIMSLPLETLSTIFALTRPPNAFENDTKSFTTSSKSSMVRTMDNSPLILRAVSSQWRDSIQGNPWMWASISLCITPTNVERRAAFLRLCLENSKDIPVFLTLSYSKNFDNDDGPPLLVHESVDSLITVNLPRIQGLRLFRPPPTWFSHISSLPQSVDALGDPISGTNGATQHPRTAALWRFPHYRKISSPLSLAGVQFRGHGITSLVIMRMQIPDLVEILSKCPNLVELHYQKSDAPNIEEFSFFPFTNPVALPCLEVLEVCMTDVCEWSRAFIRCLSVPALRELRWGLDLRHPSRDIQTFFSQLPSTLVKADLQFGFPLPYLSPQCNLEHLTVGRGRMVDLMTLLKDIGDLEHHSRDLRFKCFPKLKSLKVKGWFLGRPGFFPVLPIQHLPPVCCDLLLEALERRRGAGASISFESCLTLECQPEVRESLIEMVNEGHLRLEGDSEYELSDSEDSGF